MYLNAVPANVKKRAELQATFLISVLGVTYSAYTFSKGFTGGTFLSSLVNGTADQN
jgi:hypothetical protein